jgi:hypothetical protein
LTSIDLDPFLQLLFTLEVLISLVPILTVLALMLKKESLNWSLQPFPKLLDAPASYPYLTILLMLILLLLFELLIQAS